MSQESPHPTCTIQYEYKFLQTATSLQLKEMILSSSALPKQPLKEQYREGYSSSVSGHGVASVFYTK